MVFLLHRAREQMPDERKFSDRHVRRSDIADSVHADGVFQLRKQHLKRSLPVFGKRYDEVCEHLHGSIHFRIVKPAQIFQDTGEDAVRLVHVQVVVVAPDGDAVVRKDFLRDSLE